MNFFRPLFGGALFGGGLYAGYLFVSGDGTPVVENYYEIPGTGSLFGNTTGTGSPYGYITGTGEDL